MNKNNYIKTAKKIYPYIIDIINKYGIKCYNLKKADNCVKKILDYVSSQYVRKKISFAVCESPNKILYTLFTYKNHYFSILQYCILHGDIKTTIKLFEYLPDIEDQSTLEDLLGTILVKNSKVLFFILAAKAKTRSHLLNAFLRQTDGNQKMLNLLVSNYEVDGRNELEEMVKKYS